MRTFKALQVNQAGDITSSIQNIELADLEQGSILIDVHFSSVNYKDALAITGKAQIMRRFPTIAGIDAAGVVEQSNDEHFSIGDEVLVTGCGIGENNDGGLAEKLITSAGNVVHLPESLTLSNAMALGTAGFTAGLSVFRMLENHQAPDMGKILVTGATGGVGSIAIAYLAKLGFEVSALTSKAQTPSAKAYLESLGASEVIDRNQIEMGQRPLEGALYGGAVDSVGGDTLSWLTRVVVPEGNIASCGLAGGTDLNTTVMPFILRGVNLLGINSVVQPMSVREKVWQGLTSTLSQAEIARFIQEEISLSETIQKVGDLMDGAMTGRYLVNVKK